MKSIVYFTNGYLPARRYGGPVVSATNFVNQLGDMYDIHIVTSDHDCGSKEKLAGINPGWNLAEKAKVLYLDEKEYSKRLFEKILKEVSAEFVYVTGIFNHPLDYYAVSSSRELGLRTVIAPRGELCNNAIKIKRTKKYIYLSIMKIINQYRGVLFQSTSSEESRSIHAVLGVSENKIIQIPNFPSRVTGKKRVEKKKGELKLVYISRIHPKKNLLDTIRALKQCRYNIEFDIYGPIEDARYWELCNSEISKIPQNIKVNYLGELDHQDVPNAIQEHHGMILSTLSENYGHIISEALLCNRPVIIPRGVTPWDDVDGVGGYTHQIHDISEMAALIDYVASLEQEKFDLLIDSCEKYIDRKTNVDMLREKYISMIEGK